MVSSHPDFSSVTFWGRRQLWRRCGSHSHRTCVEVTGIITRPVPSTISLSLQSDNTEGSLEDLTEQSCKDYAQLVSQNGITAQARSESPMVMELISLCCLNSLREAWWMKSFCQGPWSEAIICIATSCSEIRMSFKLGVDSCVKCYKGELPPSVQLPAALLSGADDCTLDGADKEQCLELKDSRDREITPPLLHLDKLSLRTENPFGHPCEEVLPSGLESLPEKSGAEESLTDICPIKKNRYHQINAVKAVRGNILSEMVSKGGRNHCFYGHSLEVTLSFDKAWSSERYDYDIMFISFELEIKKPSRLQ
ncbi:hypothetical protein E5288_WYG011511 [Bos mutus]|uniref:Uncharacterized protein n=1 Tax=Bos mutus TaxID=72004 RepID=A0A6B0RI50_9CETA|nr:hypothetical protein [Bos mutus]